MGNSRKGKRPKRETRAAYHSGMGPKRKLARMGKKRKKNHAGLDATFLTRAQCLKRLQLTLRDFRRLCILKGIYPREPRKRAPKKKKGQVFYHVKDVRAIAHEPILDRFREFKAFMKKVRRVAGRDEKDLASRMETYAPTYTLHHLVRERYPRFVDALSDLDDALALVYLFAALPSEGRIQSRVTSKAKSLAAAWGTYCAATSAITKNFVSVKGVYLEASIRAGGGSGGDAGTPTTVRWIVPHSFTQHIPREVDFRVMLTFFEFYETLLGFVLYKLYSDLGVRYPLPVSVVNVSKATSPLSAYWRALIRERTNAAGSASGAVAESLEERKKQQQEEEEKERRKVNGDVLEGDESDAAGQKSAANKKKSKKEAKRAKALLKTVDDALSKIRNEASSDEEEDDDEDDEKGEGTGIAEPLKAALESMALDGGGGVGGSRDGGVGENGGKGDAIDYSVFPLDDEASKRRRLFAGLTFYLSREVPRGYIDLVCLSYGGRVGWDGHDSPVAGPSDPSITHFVLDRPALPPSLKQKSMPQNREYVQPQWVLDSANQSFLLPTGRYGLGVELPPHLSPWVDHDEEGYVPAYAEEIERIKNGEVLPPPATTSAPDEEGETSPAVDARNEEEDKEEEEESNNDDDDDGGSESQTLDDDEEDEDAAEEKIRKRKRMEDEEAKKMAKTMMSNKASRLYGRMQHGIAERKAKAEELHRRRREAEGGKDGSNSDKSKKKQKKESTTLATN